MLQPCVAAMDVRVRMLGRQLPVGTMGMNCSIKFLKAFWPRQELSFHSDSCEQRRCQQPEKRQQVQFFHDEVLARVNKKSDYKLNHAFF
jgi:hypothetical protein